MLLRLAKTTRSVGNLLCQLVSYKSNMAKTVRRLQPCSLLPIVQAEVSIIVLRSRPIVIGLAGKRQAALDNIHQLFAYRMKQKRLFPVQFFATTGSYRFYSGVVKQKNFNFDFLQQMENYWHKQLLVPFIPERIICSFRRYCLRNRSSSCKT